MSEGNGSGIGGDGGSGGLNVRRNGEWRNGREMGEPSQIQSSSFR